MDLTFPGDMGSRYGMDLSQKREGAARVNVN